MARRQRSLLRHPVVRFLLFERLLLTGSAALAFAAVAMGRVRARDTGSLRRRLARALLTSGHFGEFVLVIGDL
jgi:hypothetical protein